MFSLAAKCVAASEFGVVAASLNAPPTEVALRANPPSYVRQCSNATAV